MALLVQKYGGTSVGSVERIQAVAKRVARARLDGHDLVVVVTGFQGTSIGSAGTPEITTLGRRGFRHISGGLSSSTGSQCL